MKNRFMGSIALAGLLACSVVVLGQAAQQPGGAGAIPRTPDGKPDLSGIWRTDTSTVGPIRPTPWGASRYNYNKLPEGEGARAEYDPIMHCYRPGIARLGPPLLVPRKSIQVRMYDESTPFPGGPSEFDVIEIRYFPGRIWMLYQYNQEVRQIFTDGREHPAVDEYDHNTLWWNGHSVGEWDGDTFVVDTANIRNETWLNNLGYENRKLHLVERFRRLDAETLEIERTFTDPVALAQPYTTRAILKVRHDLTFTENVICDQHYVRKVGFGFGGILGINNHPQ